MAGESKHKREWRAGWLHSFSALTGEPIAFLYRLPPDSEGETADNRICIRPVDDVDPQSEAEWMARALNAHEALVEALHEMRAAHQREAQHPEESCSNCMQARAALQLAKGEGSAT